MPLSTIAQQVGLTAPALLKRFGSKETLLSQALLPEGPPAWIAQLLAPPGPAPRETLIAVLVEVCETFQRVGPALAALRMSPAGIHSAFDPTLPGPSRITRDLLARWLSQLSIPDPDGAADLLLGAAEARGFLTWIGPQMISDEPTPDWARARVERLLPRL